MPATIIYYPDGVMDVTDKERFIRDVKPVVAREMDAINPMTGEMTNFGGDPDSFIDLILHAYQLSDAGVTTPFVGFIYTYGWPDRMLNLDERIKNIVRAARAAINMEMEERISKRFGGRYDGKELISLAFVPKPDGAWAAA